MKPEIVRDSVACVSLTPAGTNQAFLVARPIAAGTPDAVYQRVGELLERHGLATVHERVFGAASCGGAVLTARAKWLPGAEAQPLTFVQVPPSLGGEFAGVQIHAVGRAVAASTVQEDGQPVGRTWSDGGKNFVILQAMHGRGAGDDRPEQTKRMIRRTEGLLRSQGASYHNVARTWIYLHRILDWYGPFNKARSEEYAQLGVMATPTGEHRLLPSSTGIEGANPHGAACMMDVFAVRDPRSPDAPPAAQMTNRRQQDAFRYGSAFSRAAHIEIPGGQIIHLSGTASIDEAGKTVHVGDVRAQIETTLDVVDALLGQRGLGVKDMATATLFIKRRADVDCLRQILDRRGLATIPAVYVEADVCRDDLLFEIDGIAAKCG